MSLIREVFSRQRTEGLAHFIRYSLVSGVSLGVDVLILSICHSLFGWHYLLAASVGFIIGVFTNYFLSILWVFTESRFASRSFEFLLTAGIATAGLAINDLMMWVMVERFAVYYLVAKATASAAVFFWNFVIRQYYVHAPAAASQQLEVSD